MAKHFAVRVSISPVGDTAELESVVTAFGREPNGGVLVLPGSFIAANRDLIVRLLDNSGIIRSRAKIEAAIKAARIYQEMAGRGEDFADFCWSFTDGKVLRGDGRTIPAKTELSETISKTLKQRGFNFVGPVIVYAWMQAVGIVNDHAHDCFRRKQV